MKIATIGLDLAKNVFQLHGIDAEGRVVLRRRLRRSDVVRFFARLSPCMVAWRHARAVTRPSMRFVPIKSEEQQAMLLIHRARDLLVRQHTSLINALRAHLAEFGVVLPKGGQNGRKLASMVVAGETFGMPALAVPVLLAMARRCQALEVEIAQFEREMRRRSVEDEAVQRLLKIPGIGPITATALAATVTDARAFRSAREFAAWLGLVPRQSSSGGRERLGAITKMGHAYLRRLLIVGAQAVLRQAARRPDAWLGRLLCEKPRKVAAVALANKTARIVWAVLARGETYRAAA